MQPTTAASGVPQWTPAQPFVPRRPVRGATAQTMLAMLRPRWIDIMADEQPVVLDAGFDQTGIDPDRPVRLLGYYNASRRPGPSKGLVLVLHGWEGCSHSTYNLIQAQVLVAAGYDVFRLNLRDHGPRHTMAAQSVNPYTLNRGLFLGSLIEEAATATRRIAELANGKPFYIAGASMGGNFALRLALWHGREPFPNLRGVVVVCPAVDPGKATVALDRHPATRRYFRSRWLRSLHAKQQLYPDLYDFNAVEQMPLVYDMTDWLIRRYGQLTHGRFRSAAEYFGSYTVAGARLAGLTVPTRVIAAANDPVIPVEDFYKLPAHPLLTVEVHPTGGHCGFMDVLPLRHHMPEFVLSAIDQLES